VTNDNDDQRASLKRPLAYAPSIPEQKRRRSQDTSVDKEHANEDSPQSMDLLDTSPSEPTSSPPKLINNRKASHPENFQLFLSDSKTRGSKSMPSEDDTLPSQLQLMLYRRLLLALLDRSTPFDFSLVWKARDLDPTNEFSSKFISEAGLDSNGDKILCLDHLVQYWEKSVYELDLVASPRSGSISSELMLVYRQRHIKRKKKSKKEEDFGLKVSRDDDLAAAIQASLLDLYRKNGLEDIDDTRFGGDAASIFPSANNPEASLDIAQLEQAIQPSLTDESQTPFETSQASIPTDGKQHIST
jgi:hypothetical protein